ncbi:MAG TPA: glycosyltransferase family 1 protein [Candidatus Woesebacteria bacterium]|jgi:glycosyltransferase involved in cell wall biosynthesis|nr:glycosyltransferase family 4 protein [Candidatus Shapirobacteria bacterium]HOR01659.1 glycosyltransferase family 1 protein [Candidatus Woesebacteria bacterium]
MLIGIDGNEANIANKVGVGQYAFQLLWHLYQLDKKNNYLIYLKDQPATDLPPTRSNWQYRVFGPAKLWTRFALPLHLFIDKIPLDLFFSPSHYSPIFSKFPTIPTIHDIGYLQFQDQFNRKDLHQLIHWTKQSLRHAKHIITVSQFSKDEIIKTYHLNPDKITIAYNGVNSPPKINRLAQQKILKTYQLQPGNYFLYLGTLKPNKNIPFLVKSFALFLKSTNYRSTPKLVIAGKKGWLFDEIFATVKQQGITDRVIFTDFVTEDQKWTLYRHATASILPSTYEGFGIPAIESMKVGTPVIVSNIPPFKEVVQTNGLFVNPTNESDLCQKMIKITDKKTHQRYSKLGKTQADKFSWHNTATSVIKVFENL